MMHADSTTVSIRYIVDDVDLSINFCRDLLGFNVEYQRNPGITLARRVA